ncbi:MAG: electron transfer flavoprotein subunit alpha/FixB family protein, partial [Anaerolineae bacterium]
MILVYSEKEELAFELLSKGQELKAELNTGLAAACLGQSAGEKADEYFSYGADTVYWSEHPSLADFHAEVYAQALHQIMENSGANILLLGSTKRGKELAPRVAQRLDCGCITEAIDLGVANGNLVAKRYALGGNTVASEVIKTERKVISVMPKTFELGPKEPKEGKLIKVELELKEPRLEIVERRPKGREAVSLEDAEVLICVGRGLVAEEDLELIRNLAPALRAEIGCTRSLASDFGWLSEERIVGLSGKKCNPRLYLGIGISGQIQHTVGILGSKVIVAINKDPQAPIFKIADYGIV